MMDSNKKDCWLLVRKDGDAYRIKPGMMFIGTADCDIILKSASSDKRHAVLFYDTAHKVIQLKDLNSLTGTFVNGRRIACQNYVKLNHQDSIRFGYGPDVFHVIYSEDHMLSSLIKSTNSFNDQAILDKVQTLEDNAASTGNNARTPNYVKQNSERKGSPTKNMQEADSLEDLRQGSSTQNSALSAQDSGHGTNESKEEEKSVSPSFSSLTFKRRDTRILDAPSDALLSVRLADLNRKTATIQNMNPNDNGNNSTASESEPLSESALHPMAFTVAFDNPTPKKKFSIRDSISKYAPRKAEAERKKQDKQIESQKKSIIPENKDVSVQLKKKKSHSDSHTHAEAVESNENGWKSQPEKGKTEEPKLSHGATYLIQKMLKGGKAPESSQRTEAKRNTFHKTSLDDIPSTVSVSKSSKEEYSIGNEDSKSDTGTYTIDEEINDKVVKEARQKIDEVFGVTAITEDTEPSPKQLKEPICIESCRESSSSFQTANQSPSPDQVIDQAVVPPIRPKRRLPTPPVLQPQESSSLDEDKTYLAGYNTYCVKARPKPIRLENENKAEVSNVERRSLMKESVSPNSIPNSHKLTLNNLVLLQNSCNSGKSLNFLNGHTELPMRRTPPSTHGWRRPPYGLSGSDMDLDQMKIETSSVLSDISASTEPPSMNCSTNTSRMDTGPQMKFNRAFALRRARLGLETDIPGVNKSASLKEPKSLKDNSRLTPPSPLSRQDGGRFSLRLPRNPSKSFANKTAPKTPVTKASPNSVAPKYGHRRMDSDPAKTAFLRKGIDPKMSVPEVSKVKHNLDRPSFQRAASFSNNNESSEMMSKLQKPYAWKQETVSQVTIRNQPRYSQVSNKSVADESFPREKKPLGQSDKVDLSALDSLVIQATYQLSAKLKTVAHQLLVKERDKFTEDSSERLMIDEVLPRMLDTSHTTCSGCSERKVSQDLANILKNLKRVEQSLEVLTIVIDDERMDPRRLHHHHHMSSTEDSLYVVDV